MSCSSKLRRTRGQDSSLINLRVETSAEQNWTHASGDTIRGTFTGLQSAFCSWKSTRIQPAVNSSIFFEVVSATRLAKQCGTCIYFKKCFGSTYLNASDKTACMVDHCVALELCTLMYSVSILGLWTWRLPDTKAECDSLKFKETHNVFSF